MTRILFICHGNICRSPMAEFALRDMCSRAGLAAQFDIASAATSSEELGNPVYPPARRKLAEHGIGCEGKTARRIRPEDYNNYDLLIGMDDTNMRNMARAFACCSSTPADPERPSPTRGTRVILKQHGGTSTPAASACSTSCIHR